MPTKTLETRVKIQCPSCGGAVSQEPNSPNEGSEGLFLAEQCDSVEYFDNVIGHFRCADGKCPVDRFYLGELNLPKKGAKLGAFLSSQKS